MIKDVIIEVRGGLITAVYSNDTSLNIIIIDYDNIAAGDEITTEQARAINDIEVKQVKMIY